MAYNLDFEEIKKQHSIESVADRLGLELKKNGQQLRGPCFSGAEGPRKLVITPGKGLFYSFALNEGGDAIKLVQMVQSVDAKAAAKWIVGTTEPEKKPSEGSSSKGGEARGGFTALQYLEPDHPAVEAIGFSVEVAEALGIGFAPRGVLKGTVAVPLRKEDGTIAGYIGLSEIEKQPPKWQL
ncbi:CHC2 zinc finger domain-containing protein [Sulfitobacter sp. 1A10445]|uniref:CHC2 zinc finger domain-containing protein n=1 Tax=unclassified Sulfitobacter TaxID=196795 RepID=UPI003746CB22